MDLHHNAGYQSVGGPEEKRFDGSRWGSGSDGHLYDFAKRFDTILMIIVFLNLWI